MCGRSDPEIKKKKLIVTKGNNHLFFALLFIHFFTSSVPRFPGYIKQQGHWAPSGALVTYFSPWEGSTGDGWTSRSFKKGKKILRFVSSWARASYYQTWKRTTFIYIYPGLANLLDCCCRRVPAGTAYIHLSKIIFCRAKKKYGRLSFNWMAGSRSSS